MHFIVKLFPEITIKSPPVRKRFIKHLRENLKELCRELEFPVQVVRDWDKIDVMAETDDPVAIAEVAEILSHTPGIAYFSKVQTFPLGDLEDIFQKTKAIWADALADKTFCVRVKRNGDHEFSSIEVERYVGGGLNQHTEAKGVKLKDPDITVRMEIKRDQLHVIETQTQGLGGFPLGSQEPVLSLISGGFDSTVSSYLTIKRGIRTHYCFFNLGGRAHEVGVKEVAYYLWKKFGASHRVMFVTIPFEDVVSEILEKVDNSQMGVVLKRMMLRAASKVAEEMEIQALVTGEAIGQVSSQTLTNLAVIDSVTDTLVLRPLIAMDKGEIIDVARRIGTEEFAAAMPEYCGVISRKPTTRAQEMRVAHEESKFDMAVLEAAITERRTVHIDKVMDDLDEDVQVGVQQQVESAQVVIDVRHPDETELRPLRIEGVEVLTIPFYKLSAEFPALDKTRDYLLYCDKGVMSQLHAANLRDAGYSNLGVYRPED
ncbi:tRNA 4-thiouridine(8) synthase ThiI [Aestuariicella hydrocarbonica]|uniref:tRNA sulfurtransferase n=1 Tax=Pseudomaricurvus hydrocarbonicus TaxID=1470433 RepID=A0A9E5JV80_9GAMM|nr:tRNA uracil 4-sulfurtransferase ThiI [Aestuariicella hydrocarbonica]NHO66208.1 tRNA 4-thiouridine(8) synthase ThiI [Aestuariicella hydrocarbonica]